MKKRNHNCNLQITIDSLPSGLEKNGGSRFLISTLIRTATLFRRRKNFSLILFAGLSALLCGLYYTTYYSGVTAWTLRLGVASLSTSSSSRATNFHESDERNPDDGGGGGGGSGGTNNFKRFLLHGSSMPADSSGGNFAEETEEVNTPETLNWRYWASQNYWKVNLSESGDDAEDEDVVSSGGDRPESQAILLDGRSQTGGLANVKTTKLRDLAEKRGGGGGRLACNFPRLSPFDLSITDFLKSPPPIDCSKSYPLVFRTNFRNKLIQWGQPFPSSSLTTATTQDVEEESGAGGAAANYSCCYKTITRGNGSDHNIMYSKRCYPVGREETTIPAAHEFIQVRCRKLSPAPHVDSITPAAAATNASIIKRNTNTTAAANNTRNDSHNTKLYKDMLAFVPLKPLVEARIRKYEESKRKSLYEAHHQKSRATEAESVVTESLELLKSGEESDRLSIVMLGLDAQSHMNFIRQMPQSYSFLTRNLSAVGLYGYTKVGDNTFPNVVALLSGLSDKELESVCWPTKESYFDSCPFIWKEFAESGYRTSLAEDSVWMGAFNYEKKGFIMPPTDYYLHPMNLLMAKKIGHETLANAKLCYGPRLAFEVLLDYIVKTAVTFRDSLYFQFVWSNSLFHDYLNNPRLGDELLLMTLQFLQTKGFLNNTALILLSDHGIRWGSIRSTYQGKIEERMPLAYFTFPPWFQSKYPRAMSNLKRNVLRLTSPFDVHATLKDILSLSQGRRINFDKMNEGGGESAKTPRGISLLRKVPLQRTCKMAGIDSHWCVCHSVFDVPRNSTLVESGARFVVGVINGLVKKKDQHSGLCAKLKLRKINEAKRKIDGDVDRGLHVDFLSSSPSSWRRRGRGVGTTTPNPRKSRQNKTEEEEDKGQSGGSGISTNLPLEATFTPSQDLMSLSTSSDIKTMVQLEITLVTTPGDAVFEATIYGEAEDGGEEQERLEMMNEGVAGRNHRWKLAGDISRLNLYNFQSACINDYTVKKYCYCGDVKKFD